MPISDSKYEIDESVFVVVCIVLSSVHLLCIQIPLTTEPWLHSLLSCAVRGGRLHNVLLLETICVC